LFIFIRRICKTDLKDFAEQDVGYETHTQGGIEGQSDRAFRFFFPDYQGQGEAGNEQGKSYFE
jgi:hypothetical protein